MKKCLTCHYSQVKADNLEQYHCLRFPPTPIAIHQHGGISIIFANPVVGANDYCGEHTEK